MKELAATRTAGRGDFQELRNEVHGRGSERREADHEGDTDRESGSAHVSARDEETGGASEAEHQLERARHSLLMQG
jgi:hypothetical protein